MVFGWSKLHCISITNCFFWYQHKQQYTFDIHIVICNHNISREKQNKRQLINRIMSQKQCILNENLQHLRGSSHDFKQLNSNDVHI